MVVFIWIFGLLHTHANTYIHTHTHTPHADASQNFVKSASPEIGSRVAEREGSSGKYDWKGNFRLGWTNSSHGSLKLWIVSPCDHKLTASPSTWFDAATIWRQSISSYTLNSKSAKLCQAATQCNQSGGCAFAVVVIKPLSVSDDWYDEPETSC